MKHLFLLLIASSAFFAGCTTQPGTRSLETVPSVDLDRFMGRWNVISHVPNFLEKGKVATADIYAWRDDGRIDNIFVFRKGTLDAPEHRWNGVAWVVDPASNATWKVRLIWPFTAEYRILELDSDYQWSVVSNGDGDLIWVLARSTSLSDSVYQSIVDRLHQRGLDAAKLERVPQPPSP